MYNSSPMRMYEKKIRKNKVNLFPPNRGKRAQVCPTGTGPLEISPNPPMSFYFLLERLADYVLSRS